MESKYMKTVGIIAEYDPFHNGHAWQLEQANIMGAEKVIVCLSTAATQRGALPLLPEETRVKAALTYGADIVLSLPAVYASSGAEQFARAGVAILTAAGCDTLVFGAETPDTARLMGCAQALCSVAYQEALQAKMASGARNFATAREQAMQAVCPDERFADLLSNPNDNLAVEYCKAILQQQAPLTPYALPRVGAIHGQSLAVLQGDENAQGVQNVPCDSSETVATDKPTQVQYASGSALRKLWQRDGACALRPYVRPIAYDLYCQDEQNGAYTNWQRVDIALLSRLRAYLPDGFACVRGVSEGLEYRLAEAVKTARTAEELYQALTTVRYPTARMRRLCLDAAMRIQAGQIPSLPPYLHVLGGRKEALGMLKHASLPVSASLAVLRAQNADCATVVDTQTTFCDFATLCRENIAPMGAGYTKKIVTF